MTPEEGSAAGAADGRNRVVRRVVGDADLEAAYAVRAEVFVVEQHVPVELERDELDEVAVHVVAVRDGEVVGTGRLVVEDAGFEGVDSELGAVGHLGRLAVRAGQRGQGLGIGLVRALEAAAAEAGVEVVYLAAQQHAVGFYDRLGYTAYGEVFDDAGIPHRHMWRRLPPRPATRHAACPGTSSERPGTVGRAG